MGLCVSMLQRKAKDRRHPEPRRGTPKALFVVYRDDRRPPSKPQALPLVVQLAENPGGLGFHKPGKAEATSRKYERCSYDCTDVLGRRLRMPKPRLPCGRSSTRSVAVEPPAVPERKGSAFSGPATERGVLEGCRTPMTPRRTPVWQRRILMGRRCELPRFNGLVLYDEHGRPLQSNVQNRTDHRISRTRKSESKGKNNSARTTTTLRDLL